MNRATIATSVLAAAGARLAYAALSRRPPGGHAVWSRTNHRGETVTLVEGPAVAVAAVAAALLGGGIGSGGVAAGGAGGPKLPAQGLGPRQRAALAAAGAGAAAFGCYDDLAGSGDRRGFRGHLGALASGELTSGAVKIGGIGATGMAASALLGAPSATGAAAAADVLINAGLIAGGANLLNLFDLRPGRAIKMAIATGLPLAAVPGPARQAAAAPLAAAVALLPDDLAERAMLGDAGANALGAMLAVAAAAALPRPARLAVLAGIAGLTAASEFVSFTKIIERTAALRRLDMLGRRPAAARPSAAALRSGAHAGSGAGTAGAVEPPAPASAAAAPR
jgi:hypothetical protein